MWTWWCKPMDSTKATQTESIKTFNHHISTYQWTNITPIFKKGKHEVVSNYRPISLTSHACKLLESILRERIMKHITDNNAITPPTTWVCRQKVIFNQLIKVIWRLDIISRSRLWYRCYFSWLSKSVWHCTT